MGSVSSSQSGSASYFSVYFYSRSRQPEDPNQPESPKPRSLPTAVSKTTTVHTRIPSTTATQPAKLGSIRAKERQAWYRQLKRKSPASQRRAKKSALIVRSLIIGPPAASPPKVTKTKARPELAKIKSRLIKPNTANRIIAELRALPDAGEQGEIVSTAGADSEHTTRSPGPIHAVCLEHTDAEEDRLYFSKLKEATATDNINLNVSSLAEIGSASVDGLVSLMNEIHVIDLIRAPDFGLGQPGDGDGVLAGALPTPETVIKGIEQITPQLMALGYATGRAIVPDHKDVFPPTDRMSVLTYWWGLELLLPPPSLVYLANAQSVSGAVMNFLTALSLVNNGVREIMPLVRYMSQFIDFEFSQIKKQDQGKGVVCAATWIMPAALVPRPWDFPDPPIPSINPPKDKDELETSPNANPGGPKQISPPKLEPSNGLPFLTPVPISSILDAVTTTEISTTTVDSKPTA